MLQISLCPSPELYPLYHHEEAAVIITDIFRASTTIVTAIANGASGIYPVASVEECEHIGREAGYLMAAERAVRRCSFADFGNDPEEYTPERVKGKAIVMTTTNGTRSLSIAKQSGARAILIGSLRNLSATLRLCRVRGYKRLLVVAAGWQGQVALEDCLYAGALAHQLEQAQAGVPLGDMARMASDLWQSHCLSLKARHDYLTHSEHYARLVQAGYSSTMDYCLSIDQEDFAVELDPEGWLRPALQ